MTGRADAVAPAEPVAIVLAGGASRRFGRDKAAEPVGGVASLARVVAAAREVAGRVLVVGGAGALPEGAERVADLAAGEGPLQGALAGWRAAPGRAMWLLPCDLPLVTAAHLAWLGRALPEGVGGRVLRAGDGGPGPVPGFYGAEAAGAFERAWAEGRRSLRAALDGLAVELVDAGEVAAAGLDPRGLADFDTAEGLARLLSRR